jgi:hypothetical protein
MATTITGNPVYDLLILGGVGGALIGALIFGGIVKRLWYSLFVERWFPIIAINRRPSAEGPIAIRGYAQRKKTKNKQLYLQFYKGGRTDPIQDSDLTKIGDRFYFFGYEEAPGHIVPVENKLAFLESIESPEGVQKIIKAISVLEPKGKMEAEVFRREGINDNIINVRYKSKTPPWWAQPVLAQYIGAGILLVCMLVGMSIAVPKIYEAASSYSGSLVNQGVEAGIRAGVDTGMRYCGFRINSTANLTSVNVPPDMLSNLAKTFGAPGG